MCRSRVGLAVAELRAAGIAAELYLGRAGMKAQMKYADRRGAPDGAPFRSPTRIALPLAAATI